MGQDDSNGAGDNQNNGSIPHMDDLGNPPANQSQDESMSPSNPQQPANDSPSGSTVGDLQDIKKQALQQLTPLVQNLDQQPEERFKTLMMMIQASDNQDMIKEAFQAANQITDDQAKAKALLDIVNEINYFTQNPA